MRVLLVEDNYLIGKGVARMLAQLGCDVVGPLATAADALAALEAEHVDAAILDFSLRGTTSEPVASALRASHRPFAVLTGHGRQSTFPPVFDGCPQLLKPVSVESLQEALDEFLGEKSE